MYKTIERRYVERKRSKVTKKCKRPHVILYVCTSK